MPGGFQPALPQMDQVAFGLDLARTAKLIERHLCATERRFSDDDDMAVHDGLVLDRKCVERTAELRHGEQQRRLKSFPMPRFDERADGVEVTAHDRLGKHD